MSVDYIDTEANPMDIEEGIDMVVGGEVNLFYEMMEHFIDWSLVPNLAKMKAGFEENDIAKIQNEADSLKGASSYIRAHNVMNILDRMEESINDYRVEKLFVLYPQLIEHCVYLRRYIQKVLADRKGIVLNSNEDLVPLSDNFMFIIRCKEITVIEINRFDPAKAIPKKSNPTKASSDLKDRFQMSKTPSFTELKSIPNTSCHCIIF